MCRGNQSDGPYTKINSVMDTITSYFDTSVQGWVQALPRNCTVNGSGVESVKYSECLTGAFRTASFGALAEGVAECQHLID